MKIFNTSVPVVALVPAESDEQAIKILIDRLRDAGFDVYDGGPFDAFESEGSVTQVLS